MGTCSWGGGWSQTPDSSWFLKADLKLLLCWKKKQAVWSSHKPLVTRTSHRHTLLILPKPTTFGFEINCVLLVKILVYLHKGGSEQKKRLNASSVSMTCTWRRMSTTTRTFSQTIHEFQIKPHTPVPWTGFSRWLDSSPIQSILHPPKNHPDSRHCLPEAERCVTAINQPSMWNSYSRAQRRENTITTELSNFTHAGVLDLFMPPLTVRQDLNQYR